MTVVLHYSEKTLRHALRFYLWRVYGRSYMRLTLMALLILSFVYYLNSISTWTVAGLPFILIPAIFGIVYLLQLKEGLKKLRLLDRGSARLTLDDHGVTLESARGRSEIHWEIFSGIWESRRVYLLLFTNHQFVTLPKDQVTPELVAFVREHIKVI